MARFFERRTGPLFCLYRITPLRVKLDVRSQPNRDYVSNDDIQTPLTVNHAWTKARPREMKTAGFGLRKILLVPTPRSFPPTGFQLGSSHDQCAHDGLIALSVLTETGPLFSVQI